MRYRRAVSTGLRKPVPDPLLPPAAPPPDVAAAVLKAIRLLNLMHTEQLASGDQALLREAVVLLWKVLEPMNGGEAHARVW